MRQRTGPHDLGAGVIIARVFVQDLRIFDHGAQQRFGNGVGQLHVALGGKVPFHRVHHDVGTAAFGLVVGQGQRQFGVHHRKPRAGDIVIVRAFQRRFFVGDNAAVAGLAARRGNGQHRSHRQAGPGLALARKQLPDIVFRFCQAIGDRLGRVDGRTAAHRQQEVHAFALADLNAFVHLADVRVGHNAAQQMAGDARRAHRRDNAFHQTAFDNTLASVNHQHFCAVVFLHIGGGLGMRAAAEDDLCRGIESKIVCHKLPLCLSESGLAPPAGACLKYTTPRAKSKRPGSAAAQSGKQKRDAENKRFRVPFLCSAAGGDRTRTLFPARDFKSLASACSATAA